MQGKNLLLTVVNPHVNEPREAEIALRGGSVESGSVTTLAHTELHARNTFDQREAVMPLTSELQAAGRLVHTFPPASVSALTLRVR